MSLQLSTDSSARSLPEVLRQAARTPLRKAFVCIPGVVRSFDAAKARASVQPAIDYLIDDDTSQVSHAEILDVPVVYPSGGGYATVFPLTAGDDVLLHFSQRGLTDWKDRMERGVDASASAPDAGVMFRFQDAFATPGFLAGDVNVPADAIETRVPPNGNVRINGIDAYTTEGPLLASVSIPAGTLTADPVLAAATGLPRGFSVASSSLMVAPNAYWHERVTGLQVLARLADGSVASRVSFGYRPSGGESKALHLNGTEASAVHVSYGEAGGGSSRGRHLANVSVSNSNLNGTATLATGAPSYVARTSAGRFQFTSRDAPDDVFGMWIVSKPVTQTGTVQDIIDEISVPFASLGAAPRFAGGSVPHVGHSISLSSSAVAPMIWDLSGGVRTFRLARDPNDVFGFTTQLEFYELTIGGGGGVSDSATPLSITHNSATLTQAVTLEVRLNLNSGPHDLN